MAKWKVRAEIEDLERLIRRLKNEVLKRTDSKTAIVAVGYTAPYAIYVHENLEAHHTVGRAKFLEEPSRTQRHAIVSRFEQGVKAGEKVAEALFGAGFILQTLSQAIVPVDTGFLRDSAFTRLEKK